MISEKNFYFSLKEAQNEIIKRWNDKDLEEKVSEYFGGDVPDFLLSSPKLVLFRNIIIADNEAGQVIKFSNDTGLDFVGLEYYEDKFVAFNFDKYTMAMMFIKDGKQGNGLPRVYKKKVIDIRGSEGKRFSEINTTWGTSFVDFHHHILFKKFPSFTNKVYDMSEWLERAGGSSKLYYEKIGALLIRNCILVEHFEFSGPEAVFSKDVVLSSFKRVEQIFKYKPIVVNLMEGCNNVDDSWWYHDEDVKFILKEYIKNV